MPVVFVPGKGNIQFPDNMTPYQITLAIEREILPNRRPETISAPKQPEGGIGAAWEGIKSIFESSAENQKQMTRERYGTPGSAIESALKTVGLFGVGVPMALQSASTSVQNKILEGIGLAPPPAPPPPPPPSPSGPSLGKRIDYAIGITTPEREKRETLERARRAAIYGERAVMSPDEARRQDLAFEAEAKQPENESMLGDIAYSAAASLAQMAPGVAAGLLTRNPVPAYASAFQSSAADQYYNVLNRGGTKDEAAMAADLVGASEVATEILPLGFVVKNLGRVGFKSFLKDYLGKDLPGELVATITQNAVDTAIANPDKTWGEYVNELPMQMVETAGSTLLTGGALAGAGAIAKRVTGAQEPTEEAPAAKRAAEQVPPPPPPAEFSQKLGAVGSKIILNEPGGVNEYTYRGMDEDGRVIIEAEDGSIFAEDPAEINAAIDVGAVVPTEPEEMPVPGVAFGEPEAELAPAVTPEPEAVPVAAPAPVTVPEPEGKPISRFTAEAEEPAGKPISSFTAEPGLAPITIQTLPQQLLMAAREQPGGILPAGSLTQPEVMALEEAGIRKNEEGNYEAYSLIDEADRRYKAGEIDNSMSQYDNSHIPALQQRYGAALAPAAAPAPIESIAPPEQMPIDEGVGPYMQEYATLRTAGQMRQIEDNARKIAAARGAQSVSKEDMLQSATEIDDARFKTPAVAPVAAPRAVGKKATVTIPATRNKVEVQDELLDLADVKFAEGELQNRDRSRPQTQQFLRRFTSEFDPEGLGEDRSTDRGAPIINKDNVILSGNGRTMGLEEIYEKYPEQAEKYRQFLRDSGWNIEGIERPFLARRLLSDVDEREFVTGSNEPDIAALSPPEQAAQDAQDILKPAVLAKYNGGDLKAAKNDAFISAFLAEMSPQQRENAMDDKGNISAQALKRIENALLYKAYGQAGRASDIFISKAMERSDDDTKTLTNALVDVAKDWIKFQQAVKNGEVDKKYDITGKLMETVGTVSDIKTSGTKLSDALRSPDMVNPMDPFVRDILLSFYNDNLTRMLSKKAIAEKLYAFTEVAANQQPEPDMFGKAETPSARDIWKRVDAGEGVQQPELYQSIEGTSSNLAGNPTSADIMRLAQGLPPAQRVNVRASLDKILNRFDKNGNVNRLIFDLGVLRDAVDARIERDREKRSLDRVRGFERAMENIYRNEREGKLKPKSADLIRWLLQKNPRIADDLAISITSGIDQPSAGDYGSAGRLASIFYSNASEGTAVHEVLHHTERMMPQKVRDGIRAAWGKRIEDLIAIAENTNNTDMREVLGTIVKAYYGDNVARKELRKSYEAGTIPYSMYHLSNPSEFWAVNATKLVGKRAEQTGWLGAARKWLGDFIEKIKDIFGFTNNSAIIKGLDAVLAQESGVMRGGMLGEGARRARRAARYGDVKGSDGEGPPEVASLNEKRTEKELNELDKLINSLSDAMDKEQFAIPQMSSKLKTVLGNALQSLYDISDDAAPRFDRKIERIETKILNLRAISQASLKPSNQNDRAPINKASKAETEYEKAQREAIEAEDEFIKFAFNPEDERPIMDRRSKAYKEWAKEADRLEKVNDDAKDRFQKAIARRDREALDAINNGSAADMKKAIAKAQEPDNKIMDERADIQKKNRGCD